MANYDSDRRYGLGAVLAAQRGHHNPCTSTLADTRS